MGLSRRYGFFLIIQCDLVVNGARIQLGRLLPRLQKWTQPTMLKKIDHINIVVSDLEKATDFFCRLGFSVVHQGDLEGAWIASIVNLKEVRASYVQLSFRNSGVHIELLKYFTPPSPEIQRTSIPNQIGIRHIAFEVEDIETIVSNLKDEGITFFGDIQTYPATGKKLVYFYGPDGIILELSEYQSN